MKLQDIKKFVREFPMPESLQLNKWSNITDLNKFFESHIASMESPNNNKRIKMLHYERVVKAIQLLRENKGANVKTMTSKVNIQKPNTPPPEKQNESKSTNNNDIDFNVFEGLNHNSALKPNNDFEVEIVKPKQISTPPVRENESPKKDSDNQMSLF